jgi:hypothetical protein
MFFVYAVSVCYNVNACWKNVCYTANDGNTSVILSMLEMCLLFVSVGNVSVILLILEMYLLSC